MTHWKQVPYVSGATALFAAITSRARTSNVKFVTVGDSQEDTSGDSMNVDLSFYSWQKLGVCHQSGIIPPYNHGSAANTSMNWLSAGAATGNTTKVVPDSYIPMGQSATSSGTYPSGCVRALLAYKADTNNLHSAGDYTIVDPSAGLVGDIFFYTNSAGPAEIKWNSAPVAGGPGSGSLFAPINASAVTSGLALNASSNLPVRFRTGTLPYDAAKPYAQLIYGGHDGSSYVAGTQMAGCRFTSLAGAGGIVWEPMSVGGYNTESILANHANAGPMFKLMGGPEGWDAIAIGLMNNNAYSLGDTPAQYKTKLSALITLLRSWTGATTPVLLLGDPPTTGSGWPAGTWDNFNGCAQSQYELANELVDVMAVNSQRLMHDAGYDPANAVYSADGLHPTPLGANIRASVIVNAVLRDSASGPTTSEIVAAIKADPQLGTADGGLVANAAASKAKTDLLGTGTVMLSAPVSGDGELLELILDTDYLAANGRALEWTFDQIPSITTAATGKFGLKNSENGTEVYVNSSGAVTDVGSGTFKVSFDIPNTALTGLSPEEYDWSVEVLEGSYKITIARNRQRKTRVNIVEKQT